MLRIWHVRTGRLADWWIGNTAAVDSIAFTPSGRGLVGGSWDRTVRYWDISSLKWGSETSADRRHEILRFEGHNVSRPCDKPYPTTRKLQLLFLLIGPDFLYCRLT